MKTIPLTQGKVTIVDDDDFEKFGKFKWYAAWDKSIENFYAIRNSNYDNTGKRHPIRLHREIMGNPKRKVIDHRNHNTLDNRKENLRICTNIENARNQNGSQKHSKSGLRGVYWHKVHKKWTACIRVNGKLVHLGYFDDKLIAAKEYEKANNKYFGDFGGIVK